jgi:hypothetical protein
MPSAIDLVINNAAPVAKTFSLLSPAAGDGASAKWALKEGTIMKVFPKWELSSRAGNKARKTLITFTLPSSFTEAATGLTAVGSSAQANISVTMPDDFPEALKNDFQAYVVNGVANALIKACIRDALGAN